MAFDEVMDSLSWALASLGHEVCVTQNWFSETGETNIVFGAELIDFARIPKNSIVYNLEQPSHPNMAKVKRLVQESGCRVWDYSLRSIQDWKKEGVDAVCVPIGYTPNLTRIPAATNPDIDVFFTGWMTPRRTELLEELKKQGLKVFASSACYGGARDQIISRSKVCLNVHHDGRDRFEIVRCSYLMANSRCIVTEPSSDSDEYSDLSPALSITPYRNLVNTCASYCGDSAARERTMMADKGFSLIQERNFISAVEAALDSCGPVISRPLEFRSERGAAKKQYLAEARNLEPYGRVARRYSLACESGDMKDFAPWLRDHAKGNIVEIGVRDGASTSAFLLGLEEHGGHLWSIDIQPCGELFKGHPQWSFLQADTKDQKAIIKFIPFEIDVLFIDGDHSKAGVINDIEYARQLRPGGMVIFHDIAPEPNVTNDPTWPSDDVKSVYEALCRSMEPSGWTHEEPPGRYGLGVLHKPAPQPVQLPVEVK
jgi:hypothetical protein